MEGIISIVGVVLVIVYIVLAILVICSRESVGGCIATSACFLCGGFVIVSVAEVIATFVVWAVVFVIVMAAIGVVFGG